MRSHVATKAVLATAAIIVGSGIVTTPARADVVIDLPPPPRASAMETESAAPDAATPANATTSTDAKTTIDVGAVAIERYGRVRRAPRETYGPRRNGYYGSNYGYDYGYGYYGYGYGGVYGYPYRHYPFVTRYHFGLGVHLNHGRARLFW